MNYRYIVVEGPIGSGKSAISRRLAEYFDALYLTESPERNPFLEQYYLNVTNHGLATELYFLLRRAEAVEAINDEEAGSRRVVSDFLLEKDQIFVPALLKGSEPGNEQTLFWQLKHQIMPEFPAPDLVIYLQTSLDTTKKRLHKQSEQMLNLFPSGYLKAIHTEYQRFFHLYQNAPVLIANADEMDFAENEDHFEMLVRAMADMTGNRYYLNLSEK